MVHFPRPNMASSRCEDVFLLETPGEKNGGPQPALLAHFQDIAHLRQEAVLCILVVHPEHSIPLLQSSSIEG